MGQRDKYPTGAIIEGRVRNLTDFGAFSEIEDGIDGLVHVSNLSWTKRIKHPSEVLKKGEKVRAIVLGVEPENRRLSLGVKQLQPDVWDTFFAQHRVGDVIKGKILRTAQFGALVEIAEESRALCPSRSGWSRREAGGDGCGLGARVQDRQDEPGREEGRLEHPCRWRRGQPR